MADGAGFGVKELEKLLQTGLSRLLGEIRRRVIVNPPYGRPPNPSPLMSEDEFLSEEVGYESGSFVDTPEFVFDYGFNPLSYLGRYLRWAHPSSISGRLDEKHGAFERLCCRARHGAKQLLTSESLREIAKTQSSGVLWGPFVGPLSATAVLVIVQALHSGTLVIQLSDDENFVNITHTIREATLGVQPSKMIVDNLKPSTKYSIRSCLEKLTEESIFEGVKAGWFQLSNFWTLPTSENNVAIAPTDDINDHDNECTNASAREFVSISLTIFSCDVLRNSATRSQQIFPSTGQELEVTCLLGDVFSSDTSSNISSEFYTTQVWNLFRKSEAMLADTSPMRNSSLVIGWNDSRYGSDVDVKSEEVTYKQFLQDSRRYSKKYGEVGKQRIKSANATKVPPPEPTLVRPPVSESFSALMNYFPVQSKESATRHLYRSFMMGVSMEVFVLDLRNGYLGKEQSKWLKDSLLASRALWKVVLCGAPIAVSQSSETDPKFRPVSRDRSSVLTSLPSNIESATLKVQVHVPDPSENDVDEFGRSKTSIQYLIHSIQRSRHREQVLNETSNDNASSVDMSASLAPSKAEETTENEQKTCNDEFDTEFLDSGIVFITTHCSSIGCPRQAYIATFDPAQSGKSFCAEVNVGSFTQPYGSSVKKSFRVTPHMETRFLHGGDSLLADNTTLTTQNAQLQVCKLRIALDGCLVIQLRALPSQDGHASSLSTMCEKKFKVPDS